MLSAVCIALEAGPAFLESASINQLKITIRPLVASQSVKLSACCEEGKQYPLRQSKITERFERKEKISSGFRKQYSTQCPSSGKTHSANATAPWEHEPACCLTHAPHCPLTHRPRVRSNQLVSYSTNTLSLDLFLPSGHSGLHPPPFTAIHTNVAPHPRGSGFPPLPPQSLGCRTPLTVHKWLQPRTQRAATPLSPSLEPTQATLSLPSRCPLMPAALSLAICGPLPALSLLGRGTPSYSQGTSGQHKAMKHPLPDPRVTSCSAPALRHP